MLKFLKYQLGAGCSFVKKFKDHWLSVPDILVQKGKIGQCSFISEIKSNAFLGASFTP